jgi:hypothetical protein
MGIMPAACPDEQKMRLRMHAGIYRPRKYRNKISDCFFNKCIDVFGRKGPEQFTVGVLAIQDRDSNAIFFTKLQVRFDINRVPGYSTSLQHRMDQFTQMAVRSGIENDFLGPGHLKTPPIFLRMIRILFLAAFALTVPGCNFR